jgi:hypothetical protein
MEPKGVYRQIAIVTNNSFDLLDAVILTSEDDAAVGAACPICGKTEIAGMDISERARTLGEWAGGEHAWSVKGCVCAACRSFWMLLDNGAGRRMVIYERKKVKMAGG